MLVLKGNAFYEIDEECMRRKGLKFPEEGGGRSPQHRRKKKKNQKKSPGEGGFLSLKI